MLQRPVVELIDPQVAEILRRKTPAERLAMAFEMWEFSRRVMRASIQHDHPEWGEAEIRREIYRRVHGEATP